MLILPFLSQPFASFFQNLTISPTVALESRLRQTSFEVSGYSFLSAGCSKYWPKKKLHAHRHPGRVYLHCARPLVLTAIFTSLAAQL
jgi:hypothetical protein